MSNPNKCSYGCKIDWFIENDCAKDEYYLHPTFNNGMLAYCYVADSYSLKYNTPNSIDEYLQQIAFLRLIFTIIGGTLGLYGIVIGSIILVAYMTNLGSFGTSYLTPMSPFTYKDQKDGMIKMPITDMQYRPTVIPNINPKRQGKNENSKH